MGARRAAAVVLAGLALPGCQAAGPSEATAVIAITVSPNPVVIRVACLQSQPPPEFCSASLDPTITIAETGGVGGSVEAIELAVRNQATGTEETRITLGPEWLRGQAGTDRIEAFGRVALQPVVSGYRVRYGTVPNVFFLITVRFRDDHGHLVIANQQVGGA